MKKIIIYSAVYLFLIALFVLGSIFDLNISKTIADLPQKGYFSTNFFANFIEWFGELPIFILLAFSIGIMGYKISKNSKDLKLVANIVTTLICFFVYTYGLYRAITSLGEIYDFTHELENSPVDEIISLGVAALLEFLTIILGKKVGDKTLTSLYYFALAFCIVVAFSFVYTQLIKAIISRPRFRALNIIGFDKYSPWYKISNANDTKYALAILNDDGFVSFPSGHTSWTACCIMLCFLPKYINLNKKAKIWLTIVPCIWTAIVAFARILSGAHFLTDVTFSLIVTLLSEELISFIVLKIRAKNQKKKQALKEEQERLDQEEIEEFAKM